ncbi:hypothetical protein Ciccas_011537 [Cichlidogyrus casuarinus]|uniref:Uncharacterized protein n=1 Tax=Cichlidogyrus casuarinus TaxID=1844966 RepID=A0ABD2PQY6_9PLAT
MERKQFLNSIADKLTVLNRRMQESVNEIAHIEQLYEQLVVTRNITVVNESRFSSEDLAHSQEQPEEELSNDEIIKRIISSARGYIDAIPEPNLEQMKPIPAIIGSSEFFDAFRRPPPEIYSPIEQMDEAEEDPVLSDNESTAPLAAQVANPVSAAQWWDRSRLLSK